MKRRLVGLLLVAGLLALALASAAYATTLTFHATADNAFSMYLSEKFNEQGALITSGNDWATASFGNVILNPGVNQYLQIYGIDQGGPAGFIGDFSLSDANFHFANLTQSLLTNTTDWFVSKTGFGAGTNLATDYGSNIPGGSAHWPVVSGIASNARWIWTTNHDDDDFAYISTPIYSAAVPLPPAVLLLGSGLLGLVGLRRFF